MSIKIVIADDEPITRMDIREILEAANYEVVGEASDGFDAIELCRKHLPTIVLMDIKMPLLDGLAAAKKIQNESLADGVILLTAYSDLEFVEKAKNIGVVGYIVKPVDEKSLIPALEVAMVKCQEIKKLKSDVDKATKKLEERKIIEKAKGILMKVNNLTEQEAYDYIRVLSMNKRSAMKNIAEAIIANYEQNV